MENKKEQAIRDYDLFMHLMNDDKIRFIQTTFRQKISQGLLGKPIEERLEILKKQLSELYVK